MLPTSILQLIFSSGNDQSSEALKEVFIPRRKLFRKASKYPCHLALITSTNNSSSRSICRQLLFQAALEAAAKSQSVMIVSHEPWQELPASAKLLDHTEEMIDLLSCIKFLYPANQEELFLLIAALGGITSQIDSPDLIVFDCVDAFFSTMDHNSTVHGDGDRGGHLPTFSDHLSKFSSILEDLVVTKSEFHPCSVLVTLSTSSSPQHGSVQPELLNLWFDEVWELLQDDKRSKALSGRHLILVGHHRSTVMQLVHFIADERQLKFSKLEKK